MKRYGIDLGTTNTAIAIDGTIAPQPSEDGPIVPSVVAFPPSGATLVGSAARRRRSIDARNTIYSAKRLIGRQWRSPEAKRFQSLYPFELVETQGNSVAYQTRAGAFTPRAIGSILLSTVLQDHELDDISAAIAVPSKFSEASRAATIAAARDAGLHQVELLDEPVATARAYMSRRAERPRYAVAYDLGGGTFDLAVLDCSGDDVRVLGFGGDLYLGGDDLDMALASWAAQCVLERHRWDLRTTPAVYGRLVLECERAKIRLSTEAEAPILMSQVDPAAPVANLELPLDLAVLEKVTADLVSRTFIICDEVLARARIKPSQVEAVFPAGGTTQLPMVRQAMTQYFGVEPETDLHPMHVVCIGVSVGSV